MEGRVEKTVVYIDILFGVNFVLNYILLRGTGMLCKAKVNRLRTAFGAALGAVYAICIFFPNLSVLSGLVFKLLAAMAIICAAFPIYSILGFIKLISVFYALSLIFGGIGFALLFTGGIGANLGAVMSNGIMYMNIPFWVLFLGGALFYCGVGIFSFAMRIKSRSGLKRKVIIEAGGRRVELTALADTGNILVDPISKAPVLVAELEALKGLFDFNLRMGLSSENFQEGLSEMTSRGFRARLIPFNSVGSENGVMIGFVPDMAAVREGLGLRPMECVIGVYPKSLSEDKSYRALFNPN